MLQTRPRMLIIRSASNVLLPKLNVSDLERTWARPATTSRLMLTHSLEFLLHMAEILGRA